MGLNGAPTANSKNHSHFLHSCQKPGGISKAFSSLHITNLTLRSSKSSRQLFPLHTAEGTPVALYHEQQESPSRCTLVTHLLSSVLLSESKSTDNEEKQSYSAPEMPACRVQLLTPYLREETLALQDGFVTPAFKEQKVNSFDNGKSKQKAICIS